MYKNIKKLICIILLISMLIVIYKLSSMKRKESATMTRNIFKNIMSINFVKSNVKKTDTYKRFEKTIDDSNISESEKELLVIEKIARKYNEDFRETMHSCEYGVLSIIALCALRACGVKGKKIFIFGFVFCFLFACSDEYHQTFVEGRGYELLDIIMDSTGILIGAIIFAISEKIIILFKNRNKDKVLEEK